jgi:hypothetical protein
MVRIAPLAFASLLAAGPLLAQGGTPAPGVTITADAGGLHLGAGKGNAGQALPFGTPFHVAMHILVAAIGHDVHVAFPQDCPEGPLVTVSLPGRIDLNFREDRLEGWFLATGDTVVAAQGLSVGTPRAALDTGATAWRGDSTLGLEFERNGVSGLISGDGATVTHL